MQTMTRTPCRGVLSTGTRVAPRSGFAKTAVRPAPRPLSLQTEFVSAVSSIKGLCASLAGMMLGGVQRLTSTGPAAKPLVVDVTCGKKSMGCTFGGSRRKRVRVSGFRARMQTPAGRKVLRTRRKRGRKDLCPAHKYVK